jgi:anti-sigma factor RsiW
MNSPEDNPLLETGLRHEVTPVEHAQVQAFVASYPEAATYWEEDLCLNQLLRQLPDQPVSSNFTALVLQAASQNAPAPASARVAWWSRSRLRRWIPRTALAIVAVSAGLLSYHEYQMHTRAEMAQSVARFCRVSTLVPVDTLTDFDAINRLGQAHVAVDEELFAALK